MKVFLISDISDIDGLTPVVLSKLTFSDFDYHLLHVTKLDEYLKEKMEEHFFDNYDKVFITDLCMSEEMAKVIDGTSLRDKIQVLDHHYRNLPLNSYSFIKVVDERNGIHESGTSLYYEYLLEHYLNDNIKKDSVSYMVSLVRLNDTWEWKKFGVEEARYLPILLSYYGIDFYIDNYVKFLTENNEFYFTNAEKILIEVEQRRMKDYIEEQKERVIFKEIDGFKVGIVFAELYRSDLGNALAEFYQDKVDFIIVININRSISYRGIKEDISVAEFASMYGGNGHKKAAGSPLPENLREQIADLIFKTN